MSVSALFLFIERADTRVTVALVNKDQLEILATLRETVNEDKVALEAETERLRNQVKELTDKNRMQLEHVNTLLLEKVNLQSEGIGQRERMLQRERDFGYVERSPRSPVLISIAVIYVHHWVGRTFRRM